MSDPYGWTVDVKEGPYKDTIMHDITKGPVMLLYRAQHGWRTPSKARGAMLAHQTYKFKVADIAANPTREIAVVSLETGEWQTVWAYRKKDVQHPEPNYRGGHPVEEIKDSHEEQFGAEEAPPKEEHDPTFRESTCIVCGGEPNPSGRKCICDDTGDAAVAQQNLLQENYTLRKEKERAQQRARAIMSARREARKIQRLSYGRGF